MDEKYEAAHEVNENQEEVIDSKEKAMLQLLMRFSMDISEMLEQINEIRLLTYDIRERVIQAEHRK